MGALTLIVDRRGAEVTLDGPDVIRVHYPDGQNHRIGVGAVRRIVVQGEVAISSRALCVCSANGIGVILLPGRGPGEPTQVFPHSAGQVRARIGQFRCHLDPGRRLSLAQRLVSTKIENQAKWLEAHGVVANLDRFTLHARETQNLNALMGVEGAASARYFSLWARLWEPPWRFEGRNRRPPRDPVNSMLSLGYTLAAQYVGRMAALRGLDVSIGFLHNPRTGRPSLALDLLEPLRPWVDQWVWQALNEGELKPSHFFTSDRLGCRLNKDGRAIYFDTWHNAEDNWLLKPARLALATILLGLRSEPSASQ